MSENKLPDDIVVTQVNLDEPGPPNGDDIVAEAEGDIHWEGTHKRVTLKLGSALLQLTYDTEDEQSATNAAILIASAGTGLPMLDTAELEDDGASESTDLSSDSQDWLLRQIDKGDSDYDDNLCGWMNYDTTGRDEFGRPLLDVTFESDGDPVSTHLKGRWALEYIEGSEELK